ncbi:metallophosphoesterase [Photobacterium profundum]|nr:metallophosphoesterase [Photobacterium profundum]PSV63502.1 metallophosphoesterase [Photobacterium profundum]
MDKNRLTPIAILMAALISGCSANISEKSQSTQAGDLQQPVKVAFMPDIHFHDVYATFEDGSFSGLPSSQNNSKATIRTMQAQMNSTRLFNENYFALLAALDDVVEKGIKYVALPGDFSDDGQPIHMRGLAKILDRYHEEHGLVFFAAPGNHDPVRPFSRPEGKSDFLGKDGAEQRLFSKGKNECNFDYTAEWTTVDIGNPLPTICTEEIKQWGYKEIMAILSSHGFTPQQDYIYFETPYSSDAARQNYQFETAKLEAEYSNRQYEICYEGTGGEYKQEGYTSCSIVPDTSYLVEPVEGLWLLAIDANVYKPQASTIGGESNPNQYDGSGNAGYNMMLTHKAHVVSWISDIVKAAKEKNKTLISFSHFPMTDFYNGASEEIEDIFGEGNFQLARNPESDTSKALASTGLNVHVGGHMHFNDTGVKTYNIDGKKHTLFNIQAPSLAAYVPAYKILNIQPDSKIEVETVIIEDVPRFDELFEHYETEYNYLMQENLNQTDSIWNKDILTSENYYELTDWHIRELTRLRFLPNEWPEDIRELLFKMNGEEMLILSLIDTNISLCELQNATGDDKNSCPSGDDKKLLTTFDHDWNTAKELAAKMANAKGIKLSDLSQWDGMTLATDFYRLRNADELAFRDIEKTRLHQYQLVSEALTNFKPNVYASVEDNLGDVKVGDVFKHRFGSLFYILERFATGEASDHFIIDTSKGTLTDLKNNINRNILK